MFGKMNCDFLNVSTFSRARLSFYDTKPIRGCEKSHHGVPLRKNRRDHHKYRLAQAHENAPVLVWMYDTVTIEVRSDDSLIVTPYNSKTTREVLNALLPSGFLLYAHKKHQLLRIVNQGYHYIGAGAFVIDQRNREVRGLQQMKVRYLDKSRARKLMKGYAEHVAVYKTWKEMLTPQVAREFLQARGHNNWSVRTASFMAQHDLNDPDTWVLMGASDASCYSTGPSAIQTAREYLYKLNSLYYHESLPRGEMHDRAVFNGTTYNVQY